MTVHADGQLPADTAVVLSVPDAFDDTIELRHDGDALFSGALTLPAGLWIIRATVRPPNGFADYAEFTVGVSCSGDGTQGSVCCAREDCDGALACVLGTCSDDLGLEGEPCYDGAGCSTGYCELGICRQEPACDDGRANGLETDIDCGGVRRRFGLRRRRRLQRTLSLRCMQRRDRGPGARSTHQRQRDHDRGRVEPSGADGPGLPPGSPRRAMDNQSGRQHHVDRAQCGRGQRIPPTNPMLTECRQRFAA